MCLVSYEFFLNYKDTTIFELLSLNNKLYSSFMLI